MTPDTSAFPATDWSLLRHVVGDDEPATRRLSMDELLRRYLPPMRRFLLQRFRIDEHRADDWLQGFITSKVLQSALLSRADRDRGRFRSFLSHALWQYAVDQMRRARAQAAAAGVAELHNGSWYGTASANGADPARLFDRHWAEHAIAEALRLTKQRLSETNRAAAWEVFSRRLLEQGEAARDYRVLAQEFAFERPTQAAIALNTAKRIFRRKLRDVLIGFGVTDSDLDSAIAELKNIFQN